jgi:glycosyltransferase 2 family protein
MKPAYWKQIGGWILVAAIFAFLGKMVLENWAKVRETSFTLDPLCFAAACSVFVLGYAIQVWAWYLITLKLGMAIPIGATLEGWFYSLLGKYLPGKIWFVLGRFYFYESRGKPRETITMAIYFETLTLTIAAGLLFLAAMLFFEEVRPFYSGKQMGWLLFLFAGAFVFLYPPLLQKMLNWVLIRLKREPVRLTITYKDLLWILAICVVAWMVGGFSFYLFINSIYAVSSKYILYLTGALAIACFLGLIVLLAPSGLGVREGVLVYFLSSVVPPPVAVILSVLSRVWMTFIEIGMIGVVYLLSRNRKRTAVRNEHG